MEPNVQNRLDPQVFAKKDQQSLSNLLALLQNVQNHQEQNPLKDKIIKFITHIKLDKENSTTVYETAKLLAQTFRQKQCFQFSKQQLLALKVWLHKIIASNIPLDACLFHAYVHIDNQCEHFHTAKELRDILNKTLIFERLGRAPSELLVSAVHCFELLLGRVLETEQKLSEREVAACETLTKTLLDIHYQTDPANCDAHYVALFSLRSLRTLNKICQLSTLIAQTYADELFGLVRAYCLYGVTVDKINKLPVPHKVLPSQQAVSLVATEEVTAATAALRAQAGNSGGRLSKARKPKAVQRDISAAGREPCDNKELMQLLEQGLSELKTSDSELSDLENVNFALQKQQQQQQRLSGKVRLAAIALLGQVAQAQQRKRMYGYWHALFPTTIDADCAEQRSDLLYISQCDPNVRCRIAALQVATKLIYEGKCLLAQAEIATCNSSKYLPFSQHLGSMLIATYEALISILAKEALYPVLTQALKSLAMLVKATVFKRMPDGLVRRFVAQVHPFIYHRQYNIQLSALMVMEFLLIQSELTPEIAEVVGLNKKRDQFANETKEEFELEEEGGELCDVNMQNNLETSETTTSGTTTIPRQGSWLLLRVLSNIEHIVTQQQEQNNEAIAENETIFVKSNPLLIESLQVLNTMATHFELLVPEVPRLTEIFEIIIPRLQSETFQHAATCLSTTAHHMNLWLTREQSPQIAADCVNFWIKLLPVIQTRLNYASETQQNQAEVILVDALSNMGSLIYERMPHATQIQLLSFLCCCNINIMLQAAAVRALAVYATYSTLSNDLVFLENTAELALKLVQNEALLVRTKAFWSIGNISIALLLQKQQSNAAVSAHLLQRMLQAALKACDDNDKVRCNAVRILGNLLNFLQAQQLQDAKWYDLLNAASSKLCQACNTGSSKTKWNACYALGTLLRNQALFGSNLMPWQQQVYETLCNSIVSDSNFKVRINASVALQQIELRRHFGNYFERFWTALLTAIEMSYNLDNFYEYNHRDKLQEQLCLAVCHMLRLGEVQDFVYMRAQLSEHMEVVRNTWLRVLNRMVPETAAPLMASAAIVQQKNSSELPTVLSNAIQFVAQTFVPN